MSSHPLRALLVGVLFGATLSVLGFSSWDAVHRALVLADLRLVITVFLAIALVGSLWMGLSRGEQAPPPEKVQPAVVRGALLFGAGFAITGASPALAFVALGEGKLGALATLAGILIGNVLVARLGADRGPPRKRHESVGHPSRASSFRASNATSTRVALQGSHWPPQHEGKSSSSR